MHWQVRQSFDVAATHGSCQTFGSHCNQWTNFMLFLKNLECSWAQWMNEFGIVEFHVFPVKDDHL